MPLKIPPSGRFVATVLFTDIVGSTELASSLRDEGWARVLDAHHSAVRRELKRFDGREIDTAGDGFFAAFDTPGRAISCAEAIGQAMWEMGLEIRAGLHTGECQVVDGKVAGIAVHIGARVSALAGPGEVLVTSTVRDLATGSGIEFEDRGNITLKGVSDAWHVYAVRGDESHRRPASKPPLFVMADQPGRREPGGVTGGRSGRRRAIVATIAVVIVIAATGVVLAAARDRAPPGRAHQRSNVPALLSGVARIDPVSEKVTTISHPLGNQISPVNIVSGDGFMWTLDDQTSTLIKIDPRFNTVVGSKPLPIVPYSIQLVAFGDDSVWVAHSASAVTSGSPTEVLRIDPATLKLKDTISLPSRPLTGLAFGEGAVWATLGDGELARIDVGSHRAHLATVASSADDVATGEGYVWILNSLDGALIRYDPQAKSVRGTVPVSGQPAHLAVGEGAVWITIVTSNAVERIPASLDSSAVTIPAGSRPSGVAVGDGFVWVVNRKDGTLSVLEAADGTVKDRIRVGGLPDGVVVAPSGVWVTIPRVPS